MDNKIKEKKYDRQRETIKANICICCEGKISHCNNFIWIYKDDEHTIQDRIKKVKNSITRPKKLEMYDRDGKPLLEQGGFGSIPCWSLTALLNVIPKTIPHKDANYIADRRYWTYSWSLTSNCLYYKCSILSDYGGKYDDVFAEVHYQDNPVDACVTMIEKLHELNLL